MNNKMGDWWVRSKKDPRWNCQGRAVVGGFMIPQEAKDAIEKKKSKLGDPPDDLTAEYMKD